MKLEAFLETQGWSDERMAEEVSKHLPGRRRFDRSMVNRLRNGRRTASLFIALAIEKASEGKIRAEEVPMSARSRATLRALRGSRAA